MIETPDTIRKILVRLFCAAKDAAVIAAERARFVVVEKPGS